MRHQHKHNAPPHMVRGIQSRPHWRIFCPIPVCSSGALHYTRTALSSKKAVYSAWWETDLRATGRHLLYGITQCYLPYDTSEHAPLSKTIISSSLAVNAPTSKVWWNSVHWFVRFANKLNFSGRTHGRTGRRTDARTHKRTTRKYNAAAAPIGGGAGIRMPGASSAIAYKAIVDNYSVGSFSTDQLTTNSNSCSITKLLPFETTDCSSSLKSTSHY